MACIIIPGDALFTGICISPNALLASPRRPSYDDTRFGSMQQEAPRRRGTMTTTLSTHRAPRQAVSSRACTCSATLPAQPKGLTPAALLAVPARTVAALARPVPVRAAPPVLVYAAPRAPTCAAPSKAVPGPAMAVETSHAAPMQAARVVPVAGGPGGGTRLRWQWYTRYPMNIYFIRVYI